jgi:type I restriction enzyme, S subunit
MEVRERSAKYRTRLGYRQTDVGLIPQDWEIKPLSEISPSQSVGLVINPSSYFDEHGNVPMLVGSNLSANRISWESARRISDCSNAALTASRLRTDDLVTVRVGDPGVTAVVPPELDGCNCASVMIVRRHSAFDSHWLAYLMNSPTGMRQVQSVQYGTAQKQFNISDAVSFLFPVPPAAEQGMIAKALCDVDALVDSLEQLIAKKRHIKQGAMEELLRPKVDWVTRTLSQIADIRSGGTPSTNRAEFWDGDVPWCTPTDITALGGQKYLTATSRTITGDGLKASSAEMIPAQSVVMTSRATIGECAINRVPLATNQGFKNFVPFQGTDAEFLYYLLLTKKQKFIGLCSGSTFLEIGKAHLIGFEIALPAQETEQTAIATILSDMDSEIAALEAKLAKTRQIKQGMMRELLTGRIRLV